ncbi:hypothetical protein EFZ10_05015 [Tatumella sp. TA1]|uniref:hypothetical protein n=1 Tax=Rosenbergiella collisarenosi TaxID=1544695 RepID=UPI0008F80D4D|nr:hypothetical protein [Rosenbergiella collisarenosi]MBT0722077.1 hypothetical protein [Rosenbergiella collisarenosi]QGX91044.1 hypothetical protein EFZ10_05015 [Tatumella sp. TA1]
MFNRQNNAEFLYLCKEKATNLVSAGRQVRHLYVNVGVMSFEEHDEWLAVSATCPIVVLQEESGGKK